MNDPGKVISLWFQSPQFQEKTKESVNRTFLTMDK